MNPPRVFPDTGVLLAMIVFSRDQTGQLTLTGEMLELYREGVFELVVGQAVMDELDEVLDSRFSQHRFRAVSLLMPFTNQLVRWPTPAEIAAVLSSCNDPSDAPIFASALIAQPDVVLSNDFAAFHTPQAKDFWQEHKIAVESLYGLLCVFGRRERKDDTIS
ncbi:MAG: PIN domain-containing protein [Anaerolineae bacterium]|nr:PIN domain-containing protein [Anaerolineae bacterium]